MDLERGDSLPRRVRAKHGRQNIF